MARVDGRRANELRPVSIERRFTRSAPGSVLIRAGQTQVLCTACIEDAVPPWRKASGLGWVTAEYDMLPGSTGARRSRNRGMRLDGRTQEIQRLIGRSLRAVVDMRKLGPRTIWIDCDVLDADGGTRTVSITGAYLALVDAVRASRRQGLLEADPVTDLVAAVSVGLVGGRMLLDLCYEEDRGAEVDLTVALTGEGRFVEVQGTGEAGTFDRKQMLGMMAMAESGMRKLHRIQKAALTEPRKP